MADPIAEEKKEELADEPEEKEETGKPRKKRFLFFTILSLFLIAGSVVLLSFYHPGWLRVSPPSAKAPSPSLPPQPSKEEPPSLSSSTPPKEIGAAQDMAVLLQSMKALQSKLEEVLQALEEERRFLASQQSAWLRLRLMRIATRDLTFSDFRQDWGDIALLPLLDEAQRSKAQTLYERAKQREEMLERIRLGLLRIIRSSPKEPTPSPAAQEKGWRAWLAPYLNIRRAPDARHRELNELRRQVREVLEDLEISRWPDEERWGALLEEIQQKLGKEAIEGLPQSFQPFQHDMIEFRATAREWLRRL